jgi:AAA+ ATPase superfamily predicted ATPase
MRLNGSVHISRNKDLSYALAYAPLGVSSHSRPGRVFADRKALADFLARELKIDTREINVALGALFRNGSYAIWEVWLTEQEIMNLGLGPVWSIHSAPGSLSFHPALA